LGKTPHGFVTAFRRFIFAAAQMSLLLLFFVLAFRSWSIQWRIV